VQRYVRRGEHAAQATPVPVPPSDPGTAMCSVPVASPHSCRAYRPPRSGGERQRPAGCRGRERPPAAGCHEVNRGGNRTGKRDTIAQCAPGGGVTARGWVRSAVVSDAREPAPGRSRGRATNRPAAPRRALR
jgi:hypothetical protein